MAAGRMIPLQFPLGGLDRRVSYRNQPPLTTHDAENVRPDNVLTGRATGGSRPGIGKAVERSDLGGKVNMLAQVRWISSDGFRLWQDTFYDKAMADCWSTASWIGTDPDVTDDFASLSYNAEVGAVRDVFSDLDTSQDYQIDVFIQPYPDADGNLEWHGEYVIYGRLNDTTPNVETSGIEIRIVMTGGTGAWTGTLKDYDGGALVNTYTFDTTDSPTGEARAGYLSVLVSGNNISVYWLGSAVISSQTVTAHTGTRVGFGLKCTTSETTDTLCLADYFRFQYHAGTQQTLRNSLVAACDGGLYWEDEFLGVFTQVSTNLSLNSDRLIMAAERGQKLYFADWGDEECALDSATVSASGLVISHASITSGIAGAISAYDDVAVITSGSATVTDGTYAIASAATGSVTLASACASGAGTCSIRVWRGPKVFDPSAGTLTMWTATTDLGNVPSGCPCIARFRDRLVLAGGADAPHQWIMSRSGDPDDWNVGAASNDFARATNGTSAEAGLPGEPIRAIAAHADDYLVMGLSQSWYVLSGDPAYGGQLDARSQAIGILSPKAWCVGPDGVLIALTDDGIYAHHPASNEEPKSISREKLPRELRDVETSAYTVLMEFDFRDRGVHIFITPRDKGKIRHWWLVWDVFWGQGAASLWPVRLQDDHEPFSILNFKSDDPEERCVLLGCRDGYVRRFRDAWETDQGDAIDDFVEFGPMRLGRTEDGDGLFAQLDGSLGRRSGNVTWQLRVADNFESIIDAGNHSTGTWKAGQNPTVDPRAGGGCFILRLTGAQNRAWATEKITCRTEYGGRLRTL